MGDIIGTIQREQDEIIRSPLAGVLVVQGGPGTGKTAVALHRAAYLLYTHRFPLERQGVLVVGTEPAVPALHRAGAALAGRDRRQSLHRGRVWSPRCGSAASTRPTVAKLKGDVRMVKVLARAVRSRQRPLRQDVEVPFGAGVLRLRAPATEDIIAMARRRPGTHNVRRRFVEAQVAARPGRRLPGPLGAGRPRPGRRDGPTAEEQADLAQRLRRIPEVAEALDRMWPRLSPHELLHDLLGARPLLLAGRQGDPRRPTRSAACTARAAQSLDAVAWTAADTALIDEARTTPRPAPPAARQPGAASAPRRARPPMGSGPRVWRQSPCPTNGPLSRRGRHPLLRPHRGRRGPGPLPRCSCACWPAARSRAR